jgi:hypothetical protein
LAALGVPDDIIPARVAEHLIAECQIRPRTAWRLAAELSLDLAARHYNVITGNPRAGMRGSRIWEYEQWPERGVRPTLPALQVLAQVYGTTWKSLLGLRDLEHLPPRELAEYHATADEADPPSPGAVTRRPSFRDERSASWLADAEMSPLVEAMILTRTNVDDVQLADLWSETNCLGNAYASASPASILRQLSLTRERATTLLTERQRPKQAQDLYLINAKCCAMMAWISADLGRYGPAQELNSAAWLYTQYADDHRARRWVRTSQARVEYWAGNGAESARLAADGLRYRDGTQPTDAALVLAEARGWSSVQAERQVLDAVGRWMKSEDSASAVADEDRFFNISKDRRHYMAGTSLLSVGRASLALAEFQTARQSHAELPPECRWEAMEPMIRIDMGRSYLRLGMLDAAAEEFRPFLSADVSRHPDMVRAMVDVLVTELTNQRWRTEKTARALVDALQSTQTPVRH